jgi:hypothetical protein
MWYGERQSWLLPVCTPVKDLEVSLGLIEISHDGANGHAEYIAQAKTLFKPLATDSWGVGFVMGYGRPLESDDSSHAYSFYAYIPVSESLWHDRLILHQNLGFFHGRHDPYGDNSFAWAVRGEGPIVGRMGRGLVAVLEIYGAERIYRDDAHTTTEYQAGLRTWLRPDRVQVDLSRGRTLWRPFAQDGGAGWTIGLTLVTPPFL